MSFKIGLVGKPLAGKSTFFKASTLADIPIASYPFTTIDKNEGVAYVRVDCPAKEFGKTCDPKFGFCKNNKRFVPVELIDVAGLVPGAHEGKGMGNKFLSDLNEADVLIHVVDSSGKTNAKGEPCEDHDPCEDIEFLEREIDMWYLGVMKRGWDKIVRLAKQKDEDFHVSLSGHLNAFRITKYIAKNAMIECGLDPENYENWENKDLEKLAVELRKRTKPMVIAANKMDLPSSKENIKKMKEKFPHLMIIPCSGDMELALRSAAKADLIDYVPGESDFKIKGDLTDKQKKGLEKIRNSLEKYESTGVQKALDSAVFDFLEYIAIFPGGANKLEDSDGNVLPDCFLLPKGSTALDFAYALHTDFGDNFLYAVDVRTKQKISKDHKLKNGDIIEIINAAK